MTQLQQTIEVMNVERSDQRGLTFGAVWDVLAVAESLGTRNDVRVYGKTDADGRLVNIRVTTGDSMQEGASSTKDQASTSGGGLGLHFDLGHAGEAETCNEMACLVARGVIVGRADKTHPAGLETP